MLQASLLRKLSLNPTSYQFLLRALNCLTPHLPFTSSTLPSLSLEMPASQFFLFGISRVGSVFLFGYKRDKHCFILASNFKSNSKGSSLVVQWLGLNAFTAVAWVQSLIGELKSCKPRGVPPTPEKK